MIGEQEVELAIADASPYAAAGEQLAYAAAYIDAASVSAYARRFAQVAGAKGSTASDGATAGFMLGFRLGVLAARHERREV